MIVVRWHDDLPLRLCVLGLLLAAVFYVSVINFYKPQFDIFIVAANFGNMYCINTSHYLTMFTWDLLQKVWTVV